MEGYKVIGNRGNQPFRDGLVVGCGECMHRRCGCYLRRSLARVVRNTDSDSRRELLTR